MQLKPVGKNPTKETLKGSKKLSRKDQRINRSSFYDLKKVYTGCWGFLFNGSLKEKVFLTYLNPLYRFKSKQCAYITSDSNLS